ncbi:MAG: hypothetical protein QM723_38050 [Myxococcaceae bacterium]
MSLLSTAVLCLALAASPTVSMEHHGTLREALKELAKQGNLNLVATGNLDIPAEVSLHDAAPEEALQVVAEAYDLKVVHQGKLWVLKPKAEIALSPTPPVAPVPATPPSMPSTMKMPVIPPIPPMPPMPKIKMPPNMMGHDHGAKADDGDDDNDNDKEEADSEEMHHPGAADSEDTADAIREAADRARDRAQEARDRAQEARDRAQEIRDAEREREEALKEEEAARRDEIESRVKLGGKNSAVATGPVVVAAGTRVHEAVSYGGPVKVESGARVDGDAVAFGGNVEIEAGARVDGDAVSFGGQVIKAPGAKVHGEEVSFGSKALGVSIANGSRAAVTGVNNDEHGQNAVAAFLVQFAVFFGLGFLFLMFAPARMRTIEAEIKREPVKNGLAGFVAMLAALPLTFVLLITIIGIPVAVVGWLAAGLAVIAGLIAVSNVVGERLPLFKRRRTQALVLGIGLFAVLLLSRIPVLGPLAMSMAVMVSLGAIIRTRAGARGQGMPIPETINQSGVPVA